MVDCSCGFSGTCEARGAGCSSVSDSSKCSHHLRCGMCSQFLPIGNGCLVRSVRQESPLRIRLGVISRCLEPGGCKFSECWRLTSAPKLSGKDPSDGSVSELSTGQILKKGNQGAICFVVLPVEQSVRDCKLLWKGVKTNDGRWKAGFLQDHTRLQEVSHSV